MNGTARNVQNPWPRMALAAGLTVWAGANLWSSIFRWSEIMDAENISRTIGIFLAITVTLLPLVVAIFLFWTVVVGPEDHRSRRNASRRADKPRSRDDARS